jgi:hypothetical protein
MRRGDFTAAWKISDDILTKRVATGPSWDLPRHEQWVWDGRGLSGRAVLVRCYHGLGDTIQFARFLPELQAIAGQTIVWAQPTLVPLLETMRLSARLLPLHDGDPEVDYEADIEIMELAHALRITPKSLATAVPYFDVTSAPRISTRFSVGVLAQAGNWDATRSIPADVLDLRVPGIHLLSLQIDSALPGMVDASTSDILTLASRLKALDLVITVDTMLAHLAGSLGVPTWVLLPAEPDWRWMQGRSDSPWYPSMYLFRQEQPGEWNTVVNEVRARLACVR